MKLGHIELFVRDVDAARTFYIDVLGLDLIEVQPGGFVWVAAGDVSILLRPIRAGESHPAASAYAEAACGLVLYTDDLNRTAAQLRSRGLVFGGNDGSPKCLTFADPDGHWFQLVNPRQH